MPTHADWLIEATTESIDSMSERAMAATSDQRQSYRPCIDAVNILGLAIAEDDDLVFTMVDLSNQIQADVDAQPPASSIEAFTTMLASAMKQEGTVTGEALAKIVTAAGTCTGEEWAEA